VHRTGAARIGYEARILERTTMKRHHPTMLIAGIAVLCLAMTAAAQQKVLLDFGTINTYRGWSTNAPDDNGNYWNAVDSSDYWTNLLDTAGSPTAIDMGFISGFVGGTDSYNGPAGATSVTGPGNASADYVNSVDVIVGDLGGSQSAIFDFFVNSGFVLNQLDPTKVYNLTFFGSHKFSTDDTTVYGTYTDGGFSQMVASVELDVQTPGSAWIINTNRVATLTNVTLQAANNVYIYYDGKNGNSGYLNTMEIEIIPEPALLAAGLLAWAVCARRR
jgi:hypothetical protein